MSFKTDDDNTVSFFSNLLSVHHSGHRVLNWGSKESQNLRFRVLAEIGLSKGSSVLDVGCGLGDFYLWQKNEGLDLNYCGIDITPDIIKSAQKNFPDIHFMVSDCKKLAKDVYTRDYVVASGIFYLRKHNPVSYMEETIAHLFNISRKGLAFNSLSSWGKSHDADGEFYADPLQTLSFCRSITPFVAIRHDYHLSDFTIYMYPRSLSQ